MGWASGYVEKLRSILQNCKREILFFARFGYGIFTFGESNSRGSIPDHE